MSDLHCEVCFHRCHMKEGQSGFCRARANIDGKNTDINYGRITSLALDPIEKKPLAFYHPGTTVLSAGSYGCNLACPFCQNSAISMVDGNHIQTDYVSPETLAQAAGQMPGCIGVALTYNEPLIGWEYVRDVAHEVHKRGQKMVVVSNGTVADWVLDELKGCIDAINIDLKGDEKFYGELSGKEEMVKNTIRKLAGEGVHVEITTLVIPGKNDDDHWIEEQARWLASINPDIPLHLTRYFPRYHYKTPPTPIETLESMQKIASRYLHHVLLGNV